MKHRSPSTVWFLSVFTLGLYNYYWLWSTGKDLKRLTGNQLRNNATLLLSGLISALGLGIIIWAGSVFFFVNEPAQPSAACYRAQSLSEAFPTKAEYRPSVSCELAIQKSQNYSNQQNLAVELLVAFIPFGILGSYMLLKWLVPYCVAVEAATQKRLNASNAALGLMWAGSYGLPALQAAYNNPSAIPEFASHDQTAHLRSSANAYTNKLEHSWLKPALTVIAAAMVIGFVLLIAALVAVTHIG